MTIRRRFVLVLALLTLFGAALINATPAYAKSDGTAEYLVKGGDTLTGIAKQYGLTVEKILLYNPTIKDANALRSGATIILPPGRSEGPGAKPTGRLFRSQLEKDGKTISAEDQLYLVKGGDSITRIAKAYGLTVEKLLAANPQVDDPSKLFGGELLHIPNGRAENVPLFYSTPADTSSK